MTLKILIGKTLSSIENRGDKRIIMRTADGEEFQLFHEQDCCESVRVEEIHGDLSDLIGHPILAASEKSAASGSDFDAEPSETWTFYKLATIQGSVTIRWLGTSYEYYSARVSFEQTKEKTP